MKIDFSQVITAEDKARTAAHTRTVAIKAECRARILAVASEATQRNIAQAGVIYTAMRTDGATKEKARAQAGFLPNDLARVAEWKKWVTAMQAECRRAISKGDDPVWPEVPQSVIDLAARF